MTGRSIFGVVVGIAMSMLMMQPQQSQQQQQQRQNPFAIVQTDDLGASQEKTSSDSPLANLAEFAASQFPTAQTDVRDEPAPEGQPVFSSAPPDPSYASRDCCDQLEKRITKLEDRMTAMEKRCKCGTSSTVETVVPSQTTYSQPIYSQPVYSSPAYYDYGYGGGCANGQCGMGGCANGQCGSMRSFSRVIWR